MSEQPQNGNDNSNDSDKAVGGTSTDSKAAAELGTTEGQVREAVRESGAVHAAGSEGTRAVWENTPEGKEFLDKEDERQAEIDKERQAAEEAANDEPDDEPVLDQKLQELKDSDNE